MNSRYKKNKKEFIKIRWEDNKRKIKIALAIILPIILLTLIWGKFISVNMLKSNYFEIRESSIPENFNNIKIAHFSDVHYGIGTDSKKLNKIVKRINSYEPDIVVFTGDLVDKNYKISDEDTKKIISAISKIKSKLGKYAVIGDEDYKNNNYENIMYDSGFKLLKNNYDTVYNTDNNPILVYGFDDYLKGDPSTSIFEKKNIKNIAYKIALVHEPDYANEIANGFGIDTILSGHSLYGQVKAPFIKPLHLPKGSRDYYNKKYDINGTNLFISGGCGQKTYNFRLFTLPSINIYKLNVK